MEELAGINLGVIKLKMRRVPCGEVMLTETDTRCIL